ncbi:MAG TPA: hypothetical protein VGR35_03735 [Tepidisphaeraceae bacterium]|nr:hypothetical protein [Tepidisphaeraceae bacterium]
MPARLWPILAVMLAIVGGCTTGIRGGKKYTRFAPEGSELIKTARHSGDHFIVIRMHGAKGLARLPDTKRQLERGNRVGFTRDEDGNLLAIAGNATRSLEPVPVGVMYLAWYYRPERPLHSFAYKIRDGASGAAVVAGQAAVVGGVLVGSAVIEDALEGDDANDDEPNWLKRQRKR